MARYSKEETHVHRRLVLDAQESPLIKELSHLLDDKDDKLARLSSANSELEETNEALKEEVERLKSREHVVESTVSETDLSVHWEDREHGFTDWRECKVDGSHITKQAGKQGSEGEWGEVFRAVWKTSIQVAIKENKKGDWKGELTSEMKLFLELHHPHVVACYGILKFKRKGDGVARNSIVTERCRTSLDHFLNDHEQWKNFMPDEIDMKKYTILLHVSLGLQKLHDMSVLHRDIKAGNILLDGAPGECQHCQHSGKWKICDFGEAKVLCAPRLHFARSAQWPKGWSRSLIESNRFLDITSPFLRDRGAKFYCWLNPSESLHPESDCDPPSSPTATTPQQWAQGAEWAHGAFVYLFGATVEEADPRDCFFAVTQPIDPDEELDSSPSFPEALGPFRLGQAQVIPEVDFETLTYTLPSSAHRSEHLAVLESGAAEWPLRGRISPPHEVTLSAHAKRQASIPVEATHFVWAHQACQNEDLAKIEELRRSGKLDANGGSHSDELAFITLGGYIYFAADTAVTAAGAVTPSSQDKSGTAGASLLATARVVGVSSIGTGLGLAGERYSRHGMIKRHMCGSPDCNPKLPHRCVRGDGSSPFCDMAVTAEIASPEMWAGEGIGLETDIYAFGVVMW